MQGEEGEDFSDGRSLTGHWGTDRIWIYEKRKHSPLGGSVGLGQYEVDLPLSRFQVGAMMLYS